MAIEEEQNPSSVLLLDALYCDEEELEDEVIDQEEDEDDDEHSQNKNPCLFSVLLLEQDLFWEDEELLSLFSKEQKQTQTQTQTHYADSVALDVTRSEAVEWVLKVNAHYGFTTLTAVLAINYLDRFLRSFHFQRDNPWMIQLLAVTCLSLAAKVEETQVPLLLDLQVEGAKYVFEAKAIQRMELLVLSTLEWKMHPVTPISFLDHIIRRLGLKSSLHWEFLKRCERLLLTLISDSRSVRYLPSVLATATMMHAIDKVEPLNSIEYQTQLLGVLKVSKEKVNDCYKLILELANAKTNAYGYGCNSNPHKRKFEAIPESPGGVIDADVFSCDESSNDSWSVASSSVSSSSPSSPPKPLFKKSRAPPIPSHLNRVIVGSPS